MSHGDIQAALGGLHIDGGATARTTTTTIQMTTLQTMLDRDLTTLFNDGSLDRVAMLDHPSRPTWRSLFDEDESVMYAYLLSHPSLSSSSNIDLYEIMPLLDEYIEAFMR